MGNKFFWAGIGFSFIPGFIAWQAFMSGQYISMTLWSVVGYGLIYLSKKVADEQC